jgi:hypothetical protein
MTDTYRFFLSRDERVILEFPAFTCDLSAVPMLGKASQRPACSIPCQGHRSLFRTDLQNVLGEEERGVGGMKQIGEGCSFITVRS